jgi:tRNA-specific 2-thiouridylase
MSGGVDSSVAAALLQRQGYEVIGATMLVWSPPGVEMNHTDSCCGLSAAEDARRVCARLGIRHYTLDFRDVFHDTIVRNYVEEYSRGRTPNPCVRCNEFVKFDAFLDHAQALGAEKVATGHYARVQWREERQRWTLLRGLDVAKDQSYALYRLSQEQLSRTLFPLGELTKPEVRALARELDLPTAGKPDSQETCFVPNNDYPSLLRLLAPETLRPGEIRSPEGAVLGKHTGAAQYTHGQRRRINVGSPVPLYVINIDPEAAAVTVAPNGHPALTRKVVEAEDIRCIAAVPEELLGLASLPVTAKVRYNSTDAPGKLTLSASTTAPAAGQAPGFRLRVEFDEPVWAPAPGQSLVCFQGEEVVAGGIIFD